jgi:hypothetical protein
MPHQHGFPQLTLDVKRNLSAKASPENWQNYHRPDHLSPQQNPRKRGALRPF